MSAAQKARRWRQILADLRPELPGEWSIRGTGVGTVLMREPLGWAPAWVGYTGSPSRPAGWLHAGVQPLVLPFSGWTMTYGIRMDEVTAGPPMIDLLAETAPAETRQFVLGPGLEEIDSWPADRLAEAAERDFARDPADRRKHWYQVPGWRVVNDSGSPVEPATELVAKYHDLAGRSSAKGARQLREDAAFYERLLARWHQGGRAEALGFLTEQREQALRAEKLDKLLTT
ncbi:hypothetical protein [Melissospora conviva]|uniref:hypothetical protein n=1 Tax=Melissospora conviva TaxID=3388432 RepID=UPI003C23F05A